MAGKLYRKVFSNRKEIILLFLISGALCSGFLAARFFAVPAMSVKKPEQILLQSIAYDYRVHPAKSILFPAGTEPLPPGMESYFTALTEKVKFQVTGSVKAVKHLDKLENSLDVEILLRSEGQWSKELPFKPAIVYSEPEEGLQQYSAAFELPLAMAAQFGDAIQEEIGSRSRGEGLSLVIRSTLCTGSPGAAHPVQAGGELTGEYEFILGGSLIQPRGELLFEETVFRTAPLAVPNRVRFLGPALNVPAGRILFSFLFLVFASASVCCLIREKRSRFQKMSDREQTMERIRKLYGSRLVKAGFLRDAASIYRVEVNGYGELLKIAEEVEKPIIELIPEPGSKNRHVGYYVVDGETLYCFRFEHTA